MKKLFLSLVLFLVLGGALAQNSDSARTLAVTGSGTAYGEPNMAVFEVGVNVVSEDVAAANDEAREAMAAVLEALMEAGVAERDIRTVSFNIWREERYTREGEPGPTVFRVINTVRVTVRDVTRVGELLGLAILAGANSVGSIEYTLSDFVVLEETARERAMNTVQARAEQLAALADVSLGGVISISETPEFYPGPPVPYRAEMADMATGGDVPVAAGQLSVTVTVHVVYEIQD